MAWGDRSAADLDAAAAFLASSSFCSFLSFVLAAGQHINTQQQESQSLEVLLSHYLLIKSSPSQTAFVSEFDMRDALYEAQSKLVDSWISENSGSFDESLSCPDSINFPPEDNRKIAHFFTH